MNLDEPPPLERNPEQDPVAHAVALWLMSIAHDYRAHAAELLRAAAPRDAQSRASYPELIQGTLAGAALVEMLAQQVENRRW